MEGPFLAVARSNRLCVSAGGKQYTLKPGQGLLRGSHQIVYVDEYKKELAQKERIMSIMNGADGHMHRTKEGEWIEVYNMEDDHLMKTIAFFAKKYAGANVRFGKPVTFLDALMSEKDPREDAKTTLQCSVSDGYRHLGRFVIEAIRREIDPAKIADALAPFTGMITALKEAPAESEIKALPE